MEHNKLTKKKFLEMPSADIYFICQMVDRSLCNMGFARNIEHFMGDMACARLLEPYPKITPLHDYIEEVVSSVIWEGQNVDAALLTDKTRFLWGEKLWVDHLLTAHGFQVSFLEWSKSAEEKEVGLYLEYLMDQDILPSLIERIAKEAFHILFSNRIVLRKFGEQAAYYVKETAHDLYPEKFNKAGQLRRAPIPQWVKDAVFHRDKGICVQCKTDLTRLINQQNALHYDHIVPLAKGGMNDVINLQLLCKKCNLRKSDRLVAPSATYESWYEY